MKTIYFVRHGESESNVGSSPVYLGEKASLTDKGREQARFIGERCRDIKAEALIASTAVRTQQTAEAISKATGLAVEINELFTERKAPQEILGHSKSDPETKGMVEEWETTFFKDDIRVASGENFADLKARALEALAYLLQRPEEHIIVATHGFFLHMVAAITLLGEGLTIEEFNKFGPAIWMDNTGLTILEYREQKFKRADDEYHTGWILRVWNDRAHLGEPKVI